MKNIPPRWQMANRPAAFRGRAETCARIADLIERTPVVLLWGLSGVGKSACLAEVIAARFAAHVPRTLVVDGRDIGARDPIEVALERLVGHLGAPTPSHTDDAPAALVELLEAHGVWLVCEHVERVVRDSPLGEALLLAQRFARAAKIFVVSREDPRITALRAHTVAIEPLDDESLAALLASVAPSLDTAHAREVVRRARGSPLRLLLLSQGGGLDDEGEASLLALSPIAQGVLKTLALVTSSTPRAALTRAVRGADDATLDLLARRGYVESLPRAARLHDVTRATVTENLADDERALRRKKLVEALLADDADDAGAHVALDLIASSTTPEERDALVHRFGDTLRADGASTRLFDTLVGADVLDAEAFRFLVLLALDVGDEGRARLRARAPKDALVARALAARDLAFLDLLPELPSARLAASARDLRAARAALDEGRVDDALRALADAPRGIETVEGRARALLLAEASVRALALEEARAILDDLRRARDVHDTARADTLLLAVRLVEGDLAHFANDVAELSLRLDESDASSLAKGALAALRACFDALWTPGALARRSSVYGGARLSSAAHALEARDVERATRDALALRGSARAAGDRLLALEAGVLALDASLLTDDRARARTLAEKLLTEAEATGARRFVDDARLALAFSDTPADPRALVALAARDASSPVAARRAARALGEDVPTDGLDDALLARHSLGTRVEAQVVVHAETRPWTLDAEARHILLEDGRHIDLATKGVLFELLLALARSGGAASKEDLLRSVWGVREYHPLRHDNRLKTAVRKLRRFVEGTLGDDPLETTSDGYRLRGHFRLLRDRGPLDEGNAP